jgi:hypothetical protein
LFLQQLYKEWRLLFWIVIAFIIGQCYFTYKGVKNVPFFLYYMYGQKHPKQQSIDVLLIKTSQGYYNHQQLSGREQELLLNTVNLYTNLKTKGDGTVINIDNRFINPDVKQYLYKMMCNDSTALQQFPQWWGNYFKQVSHISNDSVSVVKSIVSTTYPYTKLPTDSVIFSIKIN